LKVVFIADPAIGNLIDNQKDFSAKLGLNPDEACKDASRGAFLTTQEDIILINEEKLYTYENEEFGKRYNALYRDGHSQATQGNIAVQSNTPTEPLNYNGVPVSEIIDKWMEGVDLNNNRHNTLVDLASHLRYVIGKNPTKITEVVMALPWVQDLAKEGEDVAGTVRSVMDFKYHEYMPKKLREAMATTPKLKDDNMARWLWEWGEQIEAMAEDFPLLKDICKGLKRNQYPAALFVAGGLMMTLMTRCTTGSIIDQRSCDDLTILR
jgi:hypothetical protein